MVRRMISASLPVIDANSSALSGLLSLTRKILNMLSTKGPLGFKKPSCFAQWWVRISNKGSPWVTSPVSRCTKSALVASPTLLKNGRCSSQRKLSSAFRQFLSWLFHQSKSIWKLVARVGFIRLGNLFNILSSFRLRLGGNSCHRYGCILRFRWAWGKGPGVKPVEGH